MKSQLPGGYRLGCRESAAGATDSRVVSSERADSEADTRVSSILRKTAYSVIGVELPASSYPLRTHETLTCRPWSFGISTTEPTTGKPYNQSMVRPVQVGFTWAPAYACADHRLAGGPLRGLGSGGPRFFLFSVSGRNLIPEAKERLDSWRFEADFARALPTWG